MIGLLLREMSHIIRTAVEEEGRIAAFDDEVSEYGFWSTLWQGIKTFARWVYDNADGRLLKIAVKILEHIIKNKAGMYGLEDNGSTAPADAWLRLCDDIDKVGAGLIERSRSVAGVVSVNHVGEKEQAIMARLTAHLQRRLQPCDIVFRYEYVINPSEINLGPEFTAPTVTQVTFAVCPWHRAFVKHPNAVVSVVYLSH
uniref:Uncharacterized protein n=2 Tax=Ixodes ricinus TaxID=34613 RepID=V5HJJ2_IXORI